MRFCIYICIFFLGSSLRFQNVGFPKNSPKYLEVELNWDHINDTQPVFTFQNPDSSLSHQLHLLANEDGLPLLYYADIITPVCIDGLCKPVYIELYWDLMGEYVGYGEFPNEVLSKFDHENFEPEDYLKLHELLLDQNSVLGRRKLSDLYDISLERKVAITFKGIEVDGVSGATKKEIKTAIVDGALYSCYTLWHLANGNVSAKIKEHLPAIYDSSLEDYFLNSNYESYQYYALQMMPKSEYAQHIQQVVPILLNSKTLTRAYGLKKMPKELYSHPLIVEGLFGNFSKLDFNAKTLLIDRLKHSSPAAALVLANDVVHMSKNQLKLFLEILENTKEFHSESIFQSLYNLTLESNYPYNYMISEYLSNSN